MELNREQIIKALERSIRVSMALDYQYPSITYSKLHDALSLIKELTEENERLRSIPEQLHKEMSERMVEECKIERKLTVRKMKERLYRELAYLGAKDKFNKEYFLTEVDQIAKEMVEGHYEG